MKPYSESCVQNRDPILKVLQQELQQTTHLLEIGSGTGQHSVYFAGAFPHMIWQASELAENIPGIIHWHQDYEAPNLPAPIVLDAGKGPWPETRFDGVFSANTAHIMGWPQVEKMFAGIGQCLQIGGSFLLYGPFNYGGKYTSESNARFDQWLQERDPQSKIRHMEEVRELGLQQGLALVKDHEMPANNRILQWRKTAL